MAQQPAATVVLAVEGLVFLAVLLDHLHRPDATVLHKAMMEAEGTAHLLKVVEEVVLLLLLLVLAMEVMEQLVQLRDLASQEQEVEAVEILLVALAFLLLPVLEDLVEVETVGLETNQIIPHKLLVQMVQQTQDLAVEVEPITKTVVVAVT